MWCFPRTHLTSKSSYVLTSHFRPETRSHIGSSVWIEDVSYQHKHQESALLKFLLETKPLHCHQLRSIKTAAFRKRKTRNIIDQSWSLSNRGQQTEELDKKREKVEIYVPDYTQRIKKSLCGKEIDESKTLVCLAGPERHLQQKIISFESNKALYSYGPSHCPLSKTSSPTLRPCLHRCVHGSEENVPS